MAALSAVRQEQPLLGVLMSMSKYATQADYWKAQHDSLKRALLKCREEFCWHGNTGNKLSQDEYVRLVDMIDAALERK